jgi:hypothetical protein
VLVACVSSRVGVATCAQTNVPLPASCRYEAVPNVLRIVLVCHVEGKTVSGRISRRMRATGEENAKPTRPHERIDTQKHRRAIVLTPPFRRGKSKLPAKLGERYGVASGKTITLLLKCARAGISRVGFKQPGPVESIGRLKVRLRLKVGWGERGAGRFTHALLLFTWERMGQSQTTISKAKRGVGWTMNY